jgi:hypothetical protein
MVEIDHLEIILRQRAHAAFYIDTFEIRGRFNATGQNLCCRCARRAIIQRGPSQSDKHSRSERSGNKDLKMATRVKSSSWYHLLARDSIHYRLNEIARSRRLGES